MQIGFNNDLDHRGKTFHIQTEDRGLPAAQIETQIFCGGAILDTTIVSYQKIIDSEPDEEARTVKIRTMMQAAHRNLYKKLKSGEYDPLVGLEPMGGAAEVPDDDFAPSQDRVPSSALEMERNPEAFAIDPGLGESVDLSKLKATLAKGGVESLEMESDSDNDEPTMMIQSKDVPPAKVKAPASLSRPTGSQLASPRSAALPSVSTPLAAATAPAAPEFELPRTGTRAWEGCFAAKDDLSLTALVEAFLG
jgi:hypothetical protein